MPNVKTVILTGGVIAVSFGANYPYFWILNLSDSDVFVSVSPDIVPDGDGVMLIPAKSGRSTGDVGQVSTLYLSGSGKVEITAQYNAVCPFFKLARKGGDPDGGSIKIVDELPEIGDSKYLYLVPKSNSLSNNIYDEYLWVDGKWELVGDTAIEVDLTDYIKKDAVTNSDTIVIADDGTLRTDALYVNDLGDFAGKTLQQLKAALAAWWRIGEANASKPIISACYFSAGTDIIANWSNDYYRISGSSRRWQITPIGAYATFYGSVSYGMFLLSSFAIDAPYFVTETNNTWSAPIKLTTAADLTDYATITQLNDKQDVFLSQNKITSTTDWDTVTEFGIYTVSSSSALSDINNAPPNAYGYGFLFVMSNPQTTQDIYQIYVNGNREWYQRERYNGAWKDWDAVITDPLTTEERAKLDSITPEMLEKLKNL